jgi:prepilin peptidase CpaA
MLTVSNLNMPGRANGFVCGKIKKVLVFKLNMENFSIIFLSVILSMSAVIDLKTQKIPNLITYPTMVIALAYHAALGGVDGLLFSLTGLSVGIALLLLPYLMGGMGAGDAKLMGAVGGMIGAKAVFYAFLCTAIVGGIYALVLILMRRTYFNFFFKKQMTTLWTLILTRKYIPDPNQGSKNRPRLCYGLAIALGTGLYIFLNRSGYEIFNQF